jgi:ribosome-binding protein aMBF1 (putative translation factor)
MRDITQNAREQKQLKTRELAQLIGIDQALISKFESRNTKTN